MSITSDPSTRAESFDHHDPALATRIHDEYAALRQACPVGWSERHGGFWVVTGWEACHDLARDAGSLSSKVGLIPNTLGDHVLIPISLDPPEHSPHRALLQRWFTPARVAGFEPYIRERCRALLGPLGDEADLATGYAQPMPLEVILTVIGVPDREMGIVATAARAAIETGSMPPEEVLAAVGAAYGYLAETLVGELRVDPGDDLVSFLIGAEVEDHLLDEATIAAIAFNVVGAGFDTTFKTLSSSIAHLATHPDEQRTLRAMSDLKPAVEELLRLFAPVSVGRVATCPVERDGATIETDDAVLLAYPAANRDPDVFEDPDAPDYQRQPNRHLSFGTGIHRCLGMHLARLELLVALEELFRSTSWFELAPGATPTYHQSQVWGATSVPVVLRR